MPIHEVFSVKFRGMCGIHWRHKKAPTKVFSTKIVFSTNLGKFSLLKVFCYTILVQNNSCVCAIVYNVYSWYFIKLDPMTSYVRCALVCVPNLECALYTPFVPNMFISW